MPHLRINAGPGCGKSHTLANLFMYIRANNRTSWEKHATAEQITIYEWCRTNLPEACLHKCGYFAYNDDIVQDMKTKVHPLCECRTAHGWGASVLKSHYGYLQPHKGKSRSIGIVQQLTGTALNDMNNKEKFKWLSTINHFEKLKEELLELTFENFQLVHSKYDSLAQYQVFPEIADYAKRMLPLHKTPDRKLGIEFVDQVWLSLFVLSRPIMALGLVDEDQDLSPARLQLALRLFDNIIFCGDENQSVNAYAGADPESVNNIRKYISLELPLKESFRCPPNICNYLNALTPGAQVRPSKDKKPGVESRMTINEFIEHLKILNTEDQERPVDTTYYEKYGITFGLNEWSDSLVLCRYNAPLLKICIELINQGIKCYILGERLINDLCSIIDNRKARSLEELDDKLDTWLSLATRNAPDMICMQLKDKVDCIKAVMQHCESVDEIEMTLKAFMKPKKGYEQYLRLSTIHKAKGLEAKHTFILFPPIEYPKAKTEAEKKQEKNLHFVAVSRTKRNLTWIVEND